MNENKKGSEGGKKCSENENYPVPYLRAMLRKKIFGEPGLEVVQQTSSSARPAAPSTAHGPPALSAPGPGGVQLWPGWISGL